jgi:hypothetical protein
LVGECEIKVLKLVEVLNYKSCKIATIPYAALFINLEIAINVKLFKSFPIALHQQLFGEGDG